MPNPLNVSIIDPKDYLARKEALPVTSHSMFESASKRFHPDGFFSEAIFGQVGSRERLVKRAYLELRTTAITPHLYKQIMSLKTFYRDVVAGKTYAIFDTELKDLVKTTADDPRGETGYAFFIRTLPKIEFPQTTSSKRHDKIALINKYKDRLFIRQIIVLPAGVRDVKEDNGRMVPEEINKIYNSLLSLTEAMPQPESDDPIYDPVRFQIQMKIQAIYQYICDLLDGKGGFGQSKYSSRAVVFSNRNVITAPIISRVDSPENPSMFSADEVMVPLFQAMKGAVPLVINKLKTIFFDQIFYGGASQITLIDSITLDLKYYEVESKYTKRFTTSQGIEEIINEFRNNNTHTKPVSIPVADGKVAYLYLVYDNDDEIFVFRNKNDFLETFTQARNFSAKFADTLDRLAPLNLKDYIIVGSTALRMYGMIHHSQDLDLLVSDEDMERIRKDPDYERQPNGCYRKKDNTVDIYNDVVFPETGDTFASYSKKYKIDIDGYNVNSPERSLETYRNTGRPKDYLKIKFLKSIVPELTRIRPMSYIELCYLATYSALSDKYATSTRHPVLNLQGMAVFKLHITSTSPNRVVTLKSINGEGFTEVVLPDYPILTETTKTSMSVHPSTLDQYGGDHDGDMLGLNILMSDEATAEIKNYMESPISMVDGNGKLIYGLNDGKVVKYQLFATTYHPL